MSLLHVLQIEIRTKQCLATNWVILILKQEFRKHIQIAYPIDQLLEFQEMVDQYIVHTMVMVRPMMTVMLMFVTV